MKLTREQADSFIVNGYLSYGKIIDDGTLEVLRREYDLEFAKAKEGDSYRNLSVNNETDSDAKKAAPTHMLQIMQMGERNIHFRKLAYNSDILDIVQDIIGPNIMLFHDQGLFKPALTGGPVFWHQDNAYWKCTPPNLVSMWLTLDDVDVHNGAMQVIPGSHLKPVWHNPSESTNALLDLGGSIDASRAVVVDLPAGGCMFHHCQTLHYTQPNTTERQRRAFVLHFMPPGTIGQDGSTIRVGFGNPMLRASV